MRGDTLGQTLNLSTQCFLEIAFDFVFGLRHYNSMQPVVYGKHA